MQEYVVVLTELLRENAHNAKIYGLVKPEEKIYLGCATLRPETMCGQTNVWVRPDGEYKLIRVGDGRVLVCGAHAATNMAY